MSWNSSATSNAASSEIEQGRFIDTEYVIYEVPRSIQPSEETPEPEKSGNGYADSGKPAAIK